MEKPVWRKSYGMASKEATFRSVQQVLLDPPIDPWKIEVLRGLGFHISYGISRKVAQFVALGSLDTGRAALAMDSRRKRWRSREDEERNDGQSHSNIELTKLWGFYLYWWCWLVKHLMTVVRSRSLSQYGSYTSTILLQCRYAVQNKMVRHTECRYDMGLHADSVPVPVWYAWYGIVLTDKANLGLDGWLNGRHNSSPVPCLLQICAMAQICISWKSI